MKGSFWEVMLLRQKDFQSAEVRCLGLMPYLYCEVKCGGLVMQLRMVVYKTRDIERQSRPFAADCRRESLWRCSFSIDRAAMSDLRLDMSVDDFMDMVADELTGEGSPARPAR